MAKAGRPKEVPDYQYLARSVSAGGVTGEDGTYLEMVKVLYETGILVFACLQCTLQSNSLTFVKQKA